MKFLLNLAKIYSGEYFFNIEFDDLGVCLQFPEHLIFKERVIDEATIITRDIRKAELLLEDLKINGNTSPFYLSDGEKRLLFIFGLLESRDFLIFDEPFASLDNDYKLKVKNKIIEKSKTGKTIFYTTNRKKDIIENCKLISLSKIQ